MMRTRQTELTARYPWYEPHREWVRTVGKKGARADLAGANLARANLGGANLAGANLAWAYLARANLAWADLGGAHFEGATLAWANLTGADLTGANLVGADLLGAVLSGANLSGANLRNADLRNANLRDADLRETVLDPFNPPNGKHDGFEVVEIDGVPCAKGYRTRNSPVTGGPGYEPGKTYVAQVFSACEQSACHPGLYLEPVRKAQHGICVYAPLTDMHGVGNKFRSRRFVRVEAVR